jgi:hypothetical protein
LTGSVSSTNIYYIKHCKGIIYESKEESLDPVNWQAMRKLGYKMIDEMMIYFENIRDKPVWNPIPDEIKTYYKTPCLMIRSSRI